MWIVKGESFDDIKSKFVLNENDSKLTDKEIRENYAAAVFKCTKNDYKGYLVFIPDECTYETLVHESVHIALEVYIDCNMDISPEMDQEPLAYLTEYIYSLLLESLK